jgi:hypothetical protein
MTKNIPIAFAFLLATAVPAMSQTVIVRFDGSYTILTATNCLKLKAGDTGTFRLTPDGASVGNPSPSNTSLAFFGPFAGHSYWKAGSFTTGVTYTQPTLVQPVLIPGLIGQARFNSDVTLTAQTPIDSQVLNVNITGTITNFADSENISSGTCDVTFAAATVRRFND